MVDVICHKGSKEYLKPLKLRIDLGDKKLPKNGMAAIPGVPACPDCRFATGRTGEKFVQIITQPECPPRIFKCWLDEAVDSQS